CDHLPGIAPVAADAHLDDKLRGLQWARIAAHSGALRQMEHVHPILAGWSAALAHIDHSGEPSIPDRRSIGVAHDVPSEFPLARIVAVGVEGASFPRRGAETAGDLRIVVARVADIDRRL